jgi:hypothetical protein
MRLLLFALALLFVTPAAAQDQGKVVASCGSVTLKAGTQAFRTLNLQGQTCNSGGGTTGACSEATNYLARTTGGNEGGNASAITSLICGLVNDGVWSKLEALYVPAQQNQADAVLNLVNFSFTLTGGVATWAQYKGFSNFTAIFDTGYNPGDFSKKYLPTSGSLTAWAFDVPSTSSAFLRTSNLAPANYFFPSLSGYFYCGIHSNGDAAVPATNVAGLYVCDRPDGSTVNFYTNGVSSGSQSMTAGPSTATNIHLGGGVDGYLTTSTISEASIGGSLGAAGQAALSARMHTYMATAGQGCTEATAYLARTVGGNEGGNAANITNLICGLVADGVWSKLDVFYLWAQQNITDAPLNLVSTSYNGINGFVAGDFVAYTGFNMNGTGKYVDSGLDPTVLPVKYTQNNASYGVWAYSLSTTDGCAAGRAPSNDTAIYPKFTDGSFYGRLNNTSAGVPSTVVGGGMLVADRPDAANVWPYQNGVSAGAIPAASVTMPAGKIWFGFCNSSASGANQVLSEGHIGASLGAAGNLALYNRVKTYMASVPASKPGPKPPGPVVNPQERGK